MSPSRWSLTLLDTKRFASFNCPGPFIRLEFLTCPIPRTGLPRRRFIAGATTLAGASALGSRAAAAAGPEKEALKFGFIKLTDCAPLVIAYEKHFFEDEGLNVTLEAQANWKVLLDRVIDGQLDGAHMLAGQPLGATIGFGTKADIVTAFSMDLNGNGITVSNAGLGGDEAAAADARAARSVHPIKADALKTVVERWKAQGKAVQDGHGLSGVDAQLRTALLAGCRWASPRLLHPGDISGTKGADVLLSVTPPPQMPATLEAGTIHGYCVGEPWNQQAVFKGIGVPVITDFEIWKNNPEKVFGVTGDWAAAVSRDPRRRREGADPRLHVARCQPGEPARGGEAAGPAATTSAPTKQ